MAKRTIVRDQILKLLERKTREWAHLPNAYFQEITQIKFTRKPREMHSLAALFTINRHKYSIKNSYLQQREIIPATTYNLITVESRVGNSEGTGFAVKTEAIEEGNPKEIPLDSLEQRLEKLYKQTKLESYESFIDCFSQTNTYHSKRHLEEFTITTSKGNRKRISDLNLDLFYHLESIKPVRFVQENNSVTTPSNTIQQLLFQISRELIGDNEIHKNGFETKAEICVINEIERYANSEGSIVRSSFSGYEIKYWISFHSPKAGECSVRWGCGVDDPNLRKYKKLLIKSAGELNKEYNEFFNSKKAVSVPTGNWEVYLEPENFATQIHEAVVHSCSSETIIKHLKFPDPEDDKETENVFTIEDINTLVGNPNLQIIYNPRKKHKGGKLCWGSFRYDHEAVEPQRFYLIKKGVLSGLLADRNDSYILNRMFGKEFIKPGSSRFGISEEIEIREQTPRTSTLEVKWSENLTREELWKKFLERVEKYGRVIPYKDKRKRAGLWFKKGPHGEFTLEGLSKVYFAPAYLVFEDGEYIPIKDMLFTSNSPRIILGNIQGVASKREHITGECSLYDYFIRESIFCGPSVISGLEVRKVSQLLRRYE